MFFNLKAILINFNPENFRTMNKSKFETIGESNLKKLIADFYEGVKGDALLRPMYPIELDKAEERLYLFMMQFLGGPRTYHEQRGLPQLRKRHFPFHVDENARNRWMEIMMAALDKNHMSASEKEYLKEYFGETATFLKNR